MKILSVCPVCFLEIIVFGILKKLMETKPLKSHLWWSANKSFFNLVPDPPLQTKYWVNFEFKGFLNDFNWKYGLQESTSKTITTFAVWKLEIVSISNSLEIFVQLWKLRQKQWSKLSIGLLFETVSNSAKKQRFSFWKQYNIKIWEYLNIWNQWKFICRHDRAKLLNCVWPSQSKCLDW